MEVERPAPVIQRIKEDDHLQDLQTDEPPLKKSPPSSLVPPSSQQQSGSTPPPSLGGNAGGDDVQQHGKHLLAASLVANKYLILDQLEGSALYTCIDVHTQEELVCKVTFLDVINTA